MKKNITILAGIILILSSCMDGKLGIKNYEFTPGVSFMESSYNARRGDDITLRIVVDKPFEQQTAIPFKIEGGEAGVDYIYDGEYEFVLEPAATTAEVHISIPEEFYETKQLTVSFPSYPEGYGGGRFARVTINISGDPLYTFSFVQSHVTMHSDFVIVRARLFDEDGYEVLADYDMKIKIEPTESSTAVRGVHWDFMDGEPYAYLDEDWDTAYIYIEVLESDPDKNTIELVCGEPENFSDGDIPLVVITLPYDITKEIIGQWEGLKWTNDEFIDQWYTDATKEQRQEMKNSISVADKLTFTEDGQVIVSMEGALGDYFRNCTYYFDGSEEIQLDLDLWDPEFIEAPVCVFSEVNYSFLESDPQPYEDVRIKVYITRSRTHGDLLNIYVDSYDFDRSNSPLHYIKHTIQMRYTFKRVR